MQDDLPDATGIPDYVSTIDLLCPAAPAAHSALHPNVNSFSVPRHNRADVVIVDRVYTNPVVLACFYMGIQPSNPVGCIGQGQCTWSGSNADRIELWVPLVTTFEGSPVQGLTGDAYITL